jgi:hypothetical protein
MAMNCNINTNEQVIFHMFDSNIYLQQNMLPSVGKKYFHIIFDNMKDCGHRTNNISFHKAVGVKVCI